MFSWYSWWRILASSPTTGKVLFYCYPSISSRSIYLSGHYGLLIFYLSFSSNLVYRASLVGTHLYIAYSNCGPVPLTYHAFVYTIIRRSYCRLIYHNWIVSINLTYTLRTMFAMTLVSQICMTILLKYLQIANTIRQMNLIRATETPNVYPVYLLFIEMLAV